MDVDSGIKRGCSQPRPALEQCDWCGTHTPRAYDTSAATKLPFVAALLCDSTFCSPACLYSAAAEQLPPTRTDALQDLRQRLCADVPHGAVFRVEADSGRRLDACEHCSCEMAAPVDFSWCEFELLHTLRLCSTQCALQTVQRLGTPQHVVAFVALLQQYLEYRQQRDDMFYSRGMAQETVAALGQEHVVDSQQDD
jgi:hypothetical protein